MASCNERGVLVIIYTFCLRQIEAHECRPGYYGTHCDNTCGHCIGGHAYCDVFDGFCVNGCAWGYMGATCETVCPPTFYGYNCERECPSNCKDVDCDPTTGECSSTGCKPGFHGKFCNQACPENTYGEGCLHACSCPLCGCNPVSGSCYRTCKQKRTDRRNVISVPKDEEINSGEGLFNVEDLTQKKQTRMVCQDLEKSFKDIIRVVNETYPLPWWPFVVLLLLIAIGLYMKRREHMKLLKEHENWEETWAEGFIDKGNVSEIDTDVQETVTETVLEELTSHESEIKPPPIDEKEPPPIEEVIDKKQT